MNVHDLRRNRRAIGWIAAAVSAVVLLAGETNGSAASMLQLQLSRRLLPVASDLSVIVRIERADENRRITVAVDSADYLRSSSEELEGADAAFAHQFYFKHLPDGDYTVTATLEGTKGTREVVTGNVQVGMDVSKRR